MYFMFWRIILLCVTTATLAVGSQCVPPTFPSALHRRHLQFPDGFHVNWANTNSFFCSVFLWIVKFHFPYLPPVFVPSYWELQAFSTLSYKRYPSESVVDPVVLLWRVSLIVFYTRQQWRIWIATDSCWSSQPLLLRVRNIPGSVLGPASIMIGGGG